MKVQKSIEIKAPPEKVWPFLVEPEKILKWCITFKKFEYTGKQRSGVGTALYVEEKAGGMAFTMYGAHTIDYTLWIYEDRKPVRIYAEARSINPDFEGMDEIVITMRFNDDSMATNILSVNTRPTKHECWIVGPKGRIDVVQRGGHIPGQLVGVFSGDLLVKGELVKSDAPRFHQFAAQMQEFLNAISQKREPVVTYSQMLTQLAVIDAAKQSATAHQPVTLEI